MPAVHGRDTTVLFNATNVSPYLRSADFGADVDTAETTTFGKRWKTHLAGVAAATLGTSGLYDPGYTTLRDALQVDSGVATVCPGSGAAVGDRARMMEVTATTYAESSPVGDVVAFTWNVMAQSQVAFGLVLHPLGEDTNTTTGAGKDDSAATSTGWTAHLHVTLVDGGSWVVKLEDSADGSSWADVTGGAFTAATGATSQRLRSAASTTQLRRHVRYTATRTGGAGGDGITFALAYARSY